MDSQVSKRLLNILWIFLFSMLGFSIGRYFPTITQESLLSKPGIYVSEDGRYNLSLPPESSNYGFYLTQKSENKSIIKFGKYEKISNTIASLKTEGTIMYLYETTSDGRKGIVLVDEFKKEIFLTKESNEYILVDEDGNFIE
jgi:hypothetical protein